MKIKKIIALALCILICALFTGCSSYVSVYRSEVLDDSYNIGVDVYADKDDIAVLESNGAKLKNYLNQLCEVCEVAEHGGRFSITEDGAGNLYATLTIATDSTYVDKDDITTVESKGFFFNSYTIKFKNPLDKFKNAYKNGLAKPSKGSDMYLMWVILYGEGTLKSFTDYFDVEKSYADGLVLNFLLKTRMFYQSDAKVELVLTQKYFKWSSTVAGEDGYIEYTVKRINSWVWYALAVVIGSILVLILWLVARKSKKVPQIDDQPEIERIRVMRKNVPPSARVVTPPPPRPTDTELFDEDKTDEEPKSDTVVKDVEEEEKNDNV